MLSSHAVQISAPAKFEHISLVSMDPKRFNQMLEQEGEMASNDALQMATDEAKNALEEYIYALRSKLGEQYAEFATDEEKEKLGQELTALEDWLYEEGEDEKKSVRFFAV